MNPDYKPDKNTRQEIEKLHDEGISLSGIYLKYADMKNTKLHIWIVYCFWDRKTTPISGRNHLTTLAITQIIRSTFLKQI